MPPYYFIEENSIEIMKIAPNCPCSFAVSWSRVASLEADPLDIRNLFMFFSAVGSVIRQNMLQIGVIL